MGDDKPGAADEGSEEQIPRFFKSIRIATPGSVQDVKNPVTLPPRDSWIVLDPGTEYELNAKTQEEYLAKVQKFRRIRGNFLAACFDLEFTIDSIIGEVFFPKPRVESSEGLKRVFDEVFLKMRSFGKKIALLEKLKELPVLVDLMPGVILPDLKDLVQIRNGFAHFPIVFKPHQGDNETVIPFLALKYPPLPLDESFFRKYGSLIPKISSVLSGALEILSKDDVGASSTAERTDESTNGNTGPVYLGHSIVNTDIAEWMLE